MCHWIVISLVSEVYIFDPYCYLPLLFCLIFEAHVHLLYLFFFLNSSLEFLFFMVIPFDWFSPLPVFACFFYFCHWLLHFLLFLIKFGFPFVNSLALLSIIISGTLYFISWISSNLFSNSCKCCWSSFFLSHLIMRWFSLAGKCNVFIFVSTFICSSCRFAMSL